MKQLPDIFPVRYAMIIATGNDEELNDRPLLPDPKIEMLFRQYILKLQKEPLTKQNIRPQADYIKATFFDIDVAYIAKLEAEKDWVQKTTEALKSILPEITINHTGTGFFIETSLYSYSGAYEIPSFITFKKETEKTSFDVVRKKYSLNSSMYGYFYNKYKEILEDKISSWELYQILAKYKQPIRIEAPYSELWKFLDKRGNEGILTSNIYRAENKKLLTLLPLGNNKINQKIEIVICRSWEELFAEELSAFYKTLKRCKNCNKPLPFNYKGNYCPDLPENNNCIKERNRKRKSQSKS